MLLMMAGDMDSSSHQLFSRSSILSETCAGPTRHGYRRSRRHVVGKRLHGVSRLQGEVFDGRLR